MSTLEKFIRGLVIVVFLPFALGILLAQFIALFLINGWQGACHEFFGD